MEKQRGTELLAVVLVDERNEREECVKRSRILNDTEPRAIQ